MRKILITGSNGLLGQELVRHYCSNNNNNNVQVFACSRGKNRLEFSEGYDYKSIDLTNKKSVRTLLEDIEPDCIINTAAMTNVDACEENQALCWEINVLSLKYLIDFSQPDTQIIQVSTDFVFDGLSGPYKESDLPNPLSYYAKSKRASEILLERSDKLNWAIARTIIVYGLGNELSRDNVVLWAANKLKKGEKLTIVNDQFRSPTWSVDLAIGCALIEAQKAQGYYHLSGEETESMFQTVQRIERFLKLDKSLIEPITSNDLKRPAPRPPKTGFIITKAQEELGYNPHSLEMALETLIKDA